METVNPTPEQELAAKEAAQAKIDAAKALVHQRIAAQRKYLARLQSGKLTFKEYKALPLSARPLYARRFGVPKLAHEARGIKLEIARRRRANDVAFESRRVNRSSTV